LSFVRSVWLLFLAGSFSKLISLFYRVPLSYLLGAEGIGLYQMSYPAFVIAAILATGGLPMAITKYMAEYLALGNKQAARQLFRVGKQLLWLRGLVLAIIFYRLAPILATKVLGDPRSELPLKALAPAVFLVCPEGSLRAYFQGRQQHFIIAKAQAFEQLFRVVIMLVLAFLLLPYSLEYATAGATAGAAGGALAAIVFLRSHLKLELATKTTSAKPKWSQAARMLQDLAWPVMFGSFIMPVMQMVDAVIVPLRLQVGGIPVREATALFGHHAGMALSLVGLPTVATRALTTALVPDIAAALARQDHLQVSGRISQALKITIVLAIPAAVGLFTLAEPICWVLFGAAEAAIPLQWLAFGTVGLCLMETNSALLHAIGRGRGAVAALFIGGIVNAGINYYVCAMPALNIRGAALGTGLGFTVAAFLTLIFLSRQVPIAVNPIAFICPLSASLLMIPAVQWAFSLSKNRGWPAAVALFLAMGTGLICYGLAGYSTGMFKNCLSRTSGDKFL